ncbi:MFS transporter [Campylobacter insulaenigrae]|uniref:MFS transporter n=1 Tax=Campylobacter insulaenigrae TaxID=260714 RepID=UPI002153531C|nr:MFS transporter [Campylobacter insulaenigrae]MCR6594941.1 MFS transporter [Campylobacter insulaenigrae]
MKKTLNKKQLKILGLSSLGGTLEFYDFIIYVFFASIIANHFFPNTLEPIWKDINVYGIFAAGYLARPLGGIVMAHFGDKFGRKNMFMLSILLMVIPTFLLAIMPTFEDIGYAAPIILIIIRICQGIAVGGELPGAWVFIHEHAPQGQKNIYLSFLTASVTAGILLGSLVYISIYALFDTKEVQEWAWRIPFALGGIFGMVSVYLRKFLEETPVFKQMKTDSSLVKFPLKEVLKGPKIGIIASMLITWTLTACILIFILIMPNFLIKPEIANYKILNFDVFEKTYLQITGLLCLMASIVFSGFLADKIKAYKICIVFTLVFAVFSFLFFTEIYNLPEMKNEKFIVIFYCLTCLSAGGVVSFCPIFMNDAFKPYIRFSGISFAYNIAYAIAGGFTPQLITYLHSKAINSISYFKDNENTCYVLYGPSIYILIVCLAALVASILMMKVYNTNNTPHTKKE